MNVRQVSKLKMYLVVKEYLISFNAITKLLPNFLVFFDAFIKAIAQIQTSGEEQMFDKSGLNTSKKALKKILVTLAADASSKIQAYAKFAKNQLLLSETKFSESDLNRGSDNELHNYTQGIYDRSQSNLAALEIYGTNAETQLALSNAINSFVESIPKSRLGTTETKKSTLQLASSFDDADEALENIDMLVEIVKLSQTGFYNGYHSARKAIMTGTNSLSVKGIVTDAKTGEGIKNVNLYFVLNGNGTLAKSEKQAKAIIKKTAQKGGFNIKSIPSGIYTVTIKKNGYAEQVTTISVTDGELTELNIQL